MKMTRMMIFAAMALALTCIGYAIDAQAVAFRPPESEFDPEILRVDEKEFLGVKVKTDTKFVDGDGREFTFGDLKDKAIILVMSYYTCDGFCPSFNVDLKSVLSKASQMSQVTMGDDFIVLTLSFDENDDGQTASLFKKSLGLDENMAPNWTVAAFSDPKKIKPFTDSLGYKFFWSRPDRMFFHPNTYYFISPDEGRVTRIMHGSSAEAKDMELAVIDAKLKQIKPAQVLQLAVSLCYSYNYKDGKYGLNYPAFFAFGSLFLGITAFAVAARKTKKMTEKKRRVKETDA